MPHPSSAGEPAQSVRRRFKVGYYRPTYQFQYIQEFMAILDHQEEMVGLTGPSSDRDAALNAKIFSRSPCMLAQLKTLYEALSDGSVAQFDSGQFESEGSPETIRFAFPHQWMKEWLRETERLLTDLENYPLERV